MDFIVQNCTEPEFSKSELPSAEVVYFQLIECVQTNVQSFRFAMDDRARFADGGCPATARRV